ncbi:MAG TPA: RagB/SusD family nutrient uptake outer membrane protein [Gemmatimonadaceae bacterium]|nr:RagB/SusD family nutrient uptake outer membrane protein [Gemmatimonadaceae bacterium]
MFASNAATRKHGATRSVGRLTRGVVGLSLAVVVGAGLLACDEDFLTESPPNIIVPENLYTDLAGFQAGLNALYAQARKVREGASGTNLLMSEAWTVGVDNGFANYPAGTERIFNEWGTRNNALEDYYLQIWTWLYQTINASNTIINRAENPDVKWTEEQKNEVVAEARFFRAWCYRHLTYLWGDVPLNLEEASGESIRTDWVRTPKEDVFKQMEEDLLFAEEHLPETSDDPGKLTKAVAEHYLAELYLRMGEPEKAEEKANAVIGSGLYSLITNRYGVRANEPGVPFMDQFVDGNVNRNEGNTEVLWAFQLELDVPGGGSSIMRRYWLNRYYSLKGLAVTAEYGGRGIGRLSPTAWAINLYEPGDDRGSDFAIRKFYLYNDPDNVPSGKQLGDTLFLDWTTEKMSNPKWPSTRKWDWTDPLDESGAAQYGDQPYVRLAETYLLLAEAQFDQGKLPEAAATLNIVRERSHASPIDAGDVTIDFILDERSRELLAEGERRYALLRTGKWLERTKLHNPLASPNVTERDILFPIPQAVIDANLGAGMPQNPGY